MYGKQTVSERKQLTENCIEVLRNWVAFMESLARACEVDGVAKVISVVLIEFSFSNKDKTVSGCKQVVSHIVERQEANLKASSAIACIITLQPREELSLRRYTPL
jgi:hypothetical protein